MSAELAGWVRTHAASFRSCDPADDDFSDLEPVTEVIGDARVVGLGESTHGTREEALMKHRLVRLLSTRGFTVVALERDMAEMAAFDAILGTDVSIDTLPIAFHPWRSVEFLELVRWMQSRRRQGAPVRLAGFDMQQEVGPSSLHIVSAYLDEHAPGSVSPEDMGLVEANLSDETWGNVDPAALVAAGRVRAAVRSGDDWASKWAAQNALIVEQALAHRAAPQSTPDEEQEAMFQRDAFMAAHISWLAEHVASGANLVLWAHNFHVGRIGRYMGAKLAEEFGDAYVPLGFAFYDGQFRARTYSEDGGAVTAPSAVDAVTPEPNCVEHACHQAGLERFFVDLRGLPPSPGELLMRVVGERVKVPRELRDEFEPVPLPEAFDGLFYFETTTPLDVLEWPFG